MAELCVPPPIPPLDNTLGAAFIGNLAAAVLYGFTSLQTFMYFDRYNDGRPFKLLVAFLWVLDTLHLIFISHTLYIYSVTNFSNVLAMESVTWSIMAHVFVTGVSDVTVRGMFTHRVWLVSNKNLLLIPAIMVPSLVTLAGSIVFPIRGLQIGTYAGLKRISAVLYLSFAGGVLADVVIAAALSFSLARRKTGIRGTDSMIRILIAYSVNTGILTSLCALLVLICYATMPSNFVFIAFYFVLPKLFLNSLLATLNARDKIRNRGLRTGGIVSIPLTNVSSPLPSPRTASDHSRMLRVQVRTSTDMRSDSLPGSPDEKWKQPYTTV